MQTSDHNSHMGPGRFSTIHSECGPKQFLVQWDGDVRQIIAAMRAGNSAGGDCGARSRPPQGFDVRPTGQSRLSLAKETAA